MGSKTGVSIEETIRGRSDIQFLEKYLPRDKRVSMGI